MKKHESMMDYARKLGDDVAHFGRDVWLAGLGAVSMAAEGTGSTFDKLVDRGEKLHKSDRHHLAKALDSVSEQARRFGSNMKDTLQHTVTSVLQRTGVPSRDEVRTLIRRVETLTSKVEKLASN